MGDHKPHDAYPSHNDEGLRIPGVAPNQGKDTGAGKCAIIEPVSEQWFRPPQDPATGR